MSTTAGAKTRGCGLGTCLVATLVVAVNTPVAAQTVTYDYDTLGRITSATYADGTLIQYQYDAAGNRTLYTVVTPTAPGILRLSAAALTVSESGPSVAFEVSRTEGSFGAAALNFATGNVTASSGSDYAATSGFLNWASGDTAPRVITIPITDDVTYESNETFTLNLSNATGATLGTPSAATVTITENDPPPGGTVQFSLAPYTVLEQGGSATVTVSRINGSLGSASVNYATSDGTASAGADYTASSGTLTWADGETASKTFTVPITNDTAQESSETINVTLSAATGAVLGAPGSATVSITDNDGPGTVQFTASGVTFGCDVPPFCAI